MANYLIGDILLRLESEYPLKPDEFTDHFLSPTDCGSPEQICYSIEYRCLEFVRELQPVQKNGTYELYTTADGPVIIFHWAQCRFAYGFPLSALNEGDCVRVWVDPKMKKQIPIATVRFLSTVGLHAKLLQRGAPILHASYIDYRGKAIVFTAPAQTGKSTQAELWKVSVRAEIINGDRVLLRRRGGVWHAFGYPCCGSSSICVNRTLPLGAIVVLAQGRENHVESMSVSERVRALFSGIERYLWDSREMDLALNLAQELALQVPVIRLTCQPDTDAVYTLQNYLTQGGLSCDL